MSAQHTPGPWLCTKAKHGVDAGHYVIATVADDRGDRCLIIHAEVGDDGQGDANARLIAAAPALLEALEALLGMDVAYQRGRRVEAAVAVGRAAISKAKGEQP